MNDGGRITVVTGCIRPDTLDRINSDDSGGQYDSSGGTNGEGNPAGSACTGYVVIADKGDFSDLWCRYNHYVELVEPAELRACIRCCNDPDDCPTDMGKAHMDYCCCFFLSEWRFLLDTSGCPAVIPGNYFDCD